LFGSWLPLSTSVRGGYAVMVADVSHSLWEGQFRATGCEHL